MILSLILFPIAALIWFWRDAQWQNRVWSEKAARVRADQDRRTVEIDIDRQRARAGLPAVDRRGWP
jgi:hypothetical protein